MLSVNAIPRAVRVLRKLRRRHNPIFATAQLFVGRESPRHGRRVAAFARMRAAPPAFWRTSLGGPPVRFSVAHGLRLGENAVSFLPRPTEENAMKRLLLIGLCVLALAPLG